jgi:hypothetical protein
VEYVLLRRSLAVRIGEEPVGVRYLARLWLSACLAAAVAWAIRLALPGLRQPQLRAVVVLIPYGVTYLLAAGPEQILQRLKIRGKLKE